MGSWLYFHAPPSPLTLATCFHTRVLARATSSKGMSFPSSSESQPFILLTGKEKRPRCVPGTVPCSFLALRQEAGTVLSPALWEMKPKS